MASINRLYDCMDLVDVVIVNIRVLLECEPSGYNNTTEYAIENHCYGGIL